MGLLSIIWAIIIGFLVGVLARWIMPGTVDLGFWMTTAVGIGGSVVGGLVGSLFSRSRDGFRPAGLIMSVIGAVLLLWAWRHFG